MTTEIVLAPKVEIDYSALIKQMVEARIAEVLADRESEDFRPSLRPKRSLSSCVAVKP